MSTCFKLNNSVEIINTDFQDTDISRNFIYAFNNNYSTTTNNSGIRYGLYETDTIREYSIKNVPRSHPMGFYDAAALGTKNSNDQLVDITDLITYQPSFVNPIIIYVSSGSDISHGETAEGNNNNFNFYDECYNLINIKHSVLDTTLTNSGDNFYFMRDMKYRFIATEGFTSSHKFGLRGKHNLLQNYVSLQNIGDSFDITIPQDASNGQNDSIYYIDDSQNDISGLFSILVDASNITYLYGDISLTVHAAYKTTTPQIGSYTVPHNKRSISIKSFPIDGEIDISNSNVNLFKYDNSCSYVINEVSEVLQLLFLDEKECLNIVSQAFLIEDPNNISYYYYEFNLNNHGKIEIKNNLYNVDYGIYDGSYTIFNIDSKYPITIDNIGISDIVYIESGNTSDIINKTDYRIQALGEPFNKYNYYFNKITIIVNNENNRLQINDKIPILMVDLLTDIIPKKHYELPNNFFYTNLCEDSDAVNGIQARDLSFVLYNQEDKAFIGTFLTENNIFKLNLNQEYIEPDPPYVVVDRYNHDLSNLITSSLPSVINYDLSSFVITYTARSYDEPTIKEELRLVKIQRGPFIEIEGVNELFSNSNPDSNKMVLQTYSYPTYNIFDNINVFVYDNLQKKIFLPFEITVTSSEYYDVSALGFPNRRSKYLDPPRVLRLIDDTSLNILKYENSTSGNVIPGPIKSTVNTPDKLLSYYLSPNFKLEFAPNSDTRLDENGIRIINVKSFNINNLNSKILTESNLIDFNRTSTTPNSRSYLSTLILNEKIFSFNLDGAAVTINNIDSSENIIDISQIYTDIDNYEFDLKTSIYITNTEFRIDISDTLHQYNDLTIDGLFNEIDLFGPAHMNSQRIGDFSFNISVKGLGNEDHIFNEISNILDVNSLDTDLSRTYHVNIIDNIPPVLKFVNTLFYVEPGDIEYNYAVAEEISFNIYKSVNFHKYGESFVENSSKPLIEVSDNSVYDISVTYTFYNNQNCVLEVIGTDHKVGAVTGGSATIVYKAYDLLGNVSNDICLNITFNNFPDLNLIGDAEDTTEVFTVYEEKGITISPQGEDALDFTPIYIVNFDVGFADSFSIGWFPWPSPATGGTPKFEIRYDVVLDISIVDTYNIIYYVKSMTVASPQTNYISRIIKVVDTTQPYFTFPDLALLSGIDGSDDSVFVGIDTTDFKTSSSVQTSQNIDFSLTVFSNFEDLKHIINTFELSDNYLQAVDLSLTVALSIGGIDVSFTELGLNSVVGTDNGYLDSNNLFNKVTVGLNDASSLIFNYKVVDRYGNSFDIDRKVDIVDITVPNIDFTFDNNNIDDITYVLFPYDDCKDFSYQVFDYRKDTEKFKMELNSIIFDVDIADNYDITSINNAITIKSNSSSHTQTNIKTIADISNDIDTMALFSKVNTSMDIIYDISDNQFNEVAITRKVSIINSIVPNLVFKGNDNQIFIDFGDNTYNILDDFTITHPRLLDDDSILDLSYILPDDIKSISGENQYDPSGLVYSVSDGFPSVDKYIGFYSITKQAPYDLSSVDICINIVITNGGPKYDLLEPYNITHDAGEFFSDASFIFGVNAVSEYDKFYYSGNTDLSYLHTNYTVNYDASFDVANPTIGDYTISYEATDKNNQTSILERQIIVNDTKAPTITLSVERIDVNKFDEVLMPSAFFIDTGTYLKSIEIELHNLTNNTMRDISKITFTNSVISHTFDSGDVLLDINDTSSTDISYQLVYKAFDTVNNKQEKTLNIYVNQITSFIINPKLSVSGHDLSLNENFNSNFNNLINNNTDDLASVFNSTDLIYNSLTKTLTYEIGTLEQFNLLNYNMTATYDNVLVEEYNNTIVNNIIPNTIGNYEILFQSFNDNNNDIESLIEKINFNIVDTTPPDLSYILSTDYQNITNIKLPLISDTIYDTLLSNPSYLVNQKLSNPNLFTRDAYGNTMYSIPGINITDTDGTTTQSLSNETLESIFVPSFALFVTYKKLLPTGGYNTLPINTSINQTTETIEINPNLFDSYIDVTFEHADITFDGYGFVKFIYTDGTDDVFKHRGSGARQFLNNATNIWDTFNYNEGDHSDTVVSSCGVTSSKNYYIYCSSSITGKSTWTFRALSGGISRVILEELSIGSGMLNVTVRESSILDISTGYLLLNEGNYLQNYQVFDPAGNSSDISRVITVEKFDDPFINLNYTEDACSNIFLKTYHLQHTIYREPLGRVYDYYYGELPGNVFIISQTVNENVLGVQKVRLQLENYQNTTTERDVHVVNLSCLRSNINDFNNLIPANINDKFGLYDNSYIINIPHASNAIRLVGYNYNVDIDGMININGEYTVTHDGNIYHWGVVDLSVNSNFNRASIEYLDSDLSKVLLEDIFLYTDECRPININQISCEGLLKQTFTVDVSGYNSPDNSYQYFTLSGEIYPSIEDVNNKYITDLSRATLHLPMGKYTFIQLVDRNFYNRIKFSITEDGTHNNGVEFTKGITEYGTPGVTNAYTEFILSATTPSPLYYYSEHFPNMGGKIETRNNIVFSRGNMYVTDNVLSVDNSDVLQSFTSNDDLLNTLLISQKFDMGANKSFNVNCLTQQNINHNVLLNKSQNLIIFKKYQASPNYDPVVGGVVTHVPTYSVSPHSVISNVNLKHDLSNHYLFDVSVNMSQSNIFMYDYTIDTSTNLLSRPEINTLTQQMVVAVGVDNVANPLRNNMAYSTDNGSTWIGLNELKLDIGVSAVAYNGTSRFVATGKSSTLVDSIIYSDNGIDWYNTKSGEGIFDTGSTVVYDNTNSIWLVGGIRTPNTMAYSSNGLSWTPVNNILFEAETRGISKHNGSKILALGNGTNYSIGYSTNGVDWTGINTTKTLFSDYGNSAVYIDNISLWVAVGKGNNSIANSSDGINWTGLGIAELDEGRGVDTNNDITIVVGKKHTNGSCIYYSYDGILWISTGENIFTECNSVVWTGTTWIATGKGSIYKLAFSTDGINWVGSSNSSAIFSIEGKGAAGYSKTTILNTDANKNYEFNSLDLFHNKGVIDNYQNYFRKNKLLETRFFEKNFISKINEIKYENHVSIIDNNQELQYYLEKYLSSSRIIFSNMFNNFITFNLQTYIDLTNLDIDSERLKVLHNEIFTKHETPSNYLVDKSNLLFEEFVVNIWTDIPGEAPEIIAKTDEESILLSNGLVELNEYLLDSRDSSGVLYKIYEDIIASEGLDYVNEELKDRVFLSVRDSDMISHDYNQYIGITSQNIYHNMYINEDNVFIFHAHQELANNFKVNEPSLTLERTLTDFSNNKKYLLELSSEEDLYGCFVDLSKNIYENANKKNNTIEQDTFNYKSFVTYFFGDELPNTNDYLDEFDIRPQTLNDVCYNTHPEAYDRQLQEYHSHSYLFDLNDYFDRYIYANSNLEVPWNVYNKDKIRYTIVDVSYINEFNMFDINSKTNIMHDKNRLGALNNLQNHLAILNFKLNFISDIVTDKLIYKHSPNSYNPANHEFVNNISIQNLIALYEETDIISNSYELEIENSQLNSLYSNNFYNLKQLKKKYKLIQEIFEFHQHTEFASLLDNIYDDIRNFNNVDQLVTDASAISFNIDRMLENNFYFYYDEQTLSDLLQQSSESTIIQLSDFDILYQLLVDYTNMKQVYEKILLEFKVRHLNESIFSELSFTDLYNKTDITEFTNTLLNNFVSLNEVLENQVAYSNLYIHSPNHIGADDLCFNSFDPEFNYVENQPNIVLVDLSNSVNHIWTNFNYFLDAVIGVYDFIIKEEIYDERINYYMGGSKLLINSFYSNNLQFKFDITYDSYLYPSKYIDRIVLDLAIPDYIPPTLLFNVPDLSFNQSLSTSGSIDELIEILIADISLIEINQYQYSEQSEYHNQQNDVSFENTSIIYNDVSQNIYGNILLSNNTYSTIDIDVRNLYNGTAIFTDDIAEVEIYYTITDNANNSNRIPRTVFVKANFDYPEFFINGIPYEQFILSLGGNNWVYRAKQGITLTKNSILQGITALDTANNNRPLEINVIISQIDTEILGLYQNAITLSATSRTGLSITTTIYRDILVIIDDGIELGPGINKNCPCPVYYKKIQHNYILGSEGSNVKRLAKVILHRR